MTPRLIGRGSANMPSRPPYGVWPTDSDCKITGKARTKPTSARNASGVQRRKSRCDLAFRKPIPIPRKLASSTKLVAVDTNTLFAAVHRIRASSTNSIRKLANASLI